MPNLSDEEFFAADSSPKTMSDEEFFGGQPKVMKDAEFFNEPEGSMIKQIGKSVVQGAGGLLASSLEGFAGGRANQPSYPQGQSPLEQAARGDPAFAENFTTGPTAPPSPITEDPIYKRGKQLETASTFPREAGYNGNTWTELLAGGAGSMLAGMGLGMINPGAAGATYIGAGMGEATQNAIKAGASPEQIQTAARWGAPVGATDLVDLGLPYVGKIVKGVTRRAVTGLTGEAIQEGGQQFLQNVISQQVHSPNQSLTEDVLTNAAVGGLLGGGAGVVLPGHGDHGPAPAGPAGPADPTAVHDILNTFMATPEGNKVATPGTPAPATPTIDISQPPPTEPQAPREPIDLPAMEDRPLALGQTPIFYSQLAKVVEEKLPESASPEQIMATLRNAPGVKEEEIADTGVEAFLTSQPGKVSKADLLAHLEENAMQVTEVLNAGKEVWRIENERGYKVSRNQYDSKEQADAAAAALTRRFGPLRTVSEFLPGATQYEAYATPGGKNYRELLLTVPQKAPPRPSEGFSSTEEARVYNTAARTDYSGPHWQAPNVIAHVRFTDRHDATGQPVLHIEEIQSDWHQSGRKFGYKGRSDAEIHAEHRALTGEFDSSGIAGSLRGQEIVDRLRELTDELRSNIYAVPNAPFKTTWSELAIKRMIRWAADNGYSRISWNNGELAAQYAAGGVTDPKTIAGLREFYDKIIPSIMRKWAKRLGGTIGATELPFTQASTLFRRAMGGMQRVYFLEIPETAKTYVQRGLPLYDKPLSVGEDVTSFKRTEFNDKATAPMQAAVDKAVKALTEFADKFKFGKNLIVDIQWNDKKGVKGYPRAQGLAEAHVNFYAIRMDASMFGGNIADFYSTLMHEFGHIVMFDKFDALPDAHKQNIKQAFADFINDLNNDPTVANLFFKRQSAIRNLGFTPAEQLAYANWRIKDMSLKDVRYHLSFDEWFADQVARWATTSDEAVSIVDKYMSGIGKALRFAYEWMATKFGFEFRPSLIMHNWLQSYISNGAPLTMQAYDALDVRTQKANLRIVEPDVPMPPQQPAVQPIRNTTNQAFNGATPIPVQQMAAHADHMNRFYKYMAGLLELAQVNRLFTPLTRYVEGVVAMHREESKIQDAAVRITKDWRSLGKQGENLTAFLDDMTNMVYRTPDEVKRGVVRQPTQQEVADLVRKHKLSAAGQQVLGKVQNFFQTFLQLVAQNAKDDALRLISDPVQQANRIDEINGQITNLQRRPYFPFMRFGSHYVTVKDANGKVLWFETFEQSGLRSAEKKQQARLAELQAQYGRDAVSHGVLPEHSEMLVGLPSTLLAHMRDRMTLTPAQLDALEQLQFELSPSLSFKHRFQHKAYTGGYSKDFARSFARYAFTGARYYSRTKFVWYLQERIRDARKVGGNKAGEISDYMADHLENTILDARGDYGIFKGGIFLYAMGYVPAAATQNLTQTPMITYPWLASKFGDTRTAVAMAKAMGRLSTFYRRGNYENATEFEMQALSYGIRTGRISETQAPELAGLSSGGNLLYGTGGNPLQRTAVWLQEHGAAMFEAAEQFNRRIAYRAALELAMNNPTAGVVREATSRYASEYQNLIQAQRFTPQQAAAIVTANHAVETTQFVYARYARPRFMRGRLSGTIFVFKRYIQSVLMLFLNGDKGYRIRFLLAAMLMGGMGGIPGYEELKALVTAGMRYLGYGDDPELEVRRYIMAFAKGLIPPDLVLHGLSRRGFGIPSLLDLMGNLFTGQPGRGLLLPTPGKNVPFPMLDRSKAMSPGAIIPGIGLLTGQDTDKTIADEAQKASGAVFGVGFNMYRAITDNHLAVTDPKRWERAVPRLIANSSKMYRAFTEGRDRTRGGPNSGSTVVSYDIRDPEQMMEAIALGLGYNNLRTTQHWDTVAAEQEHKKYIDTKRMGLLEQFFEAQQGGQEPELEAVRSAVRKFNTDIRGTDDAPKAITPEVILASIKKRAMEKNARETGIPTRKSDIPAARGIQELFPENTIDVKRR